MAYSDTWHITNYEVEHARYKVRDFRPLTAICLEDLVPDDNFHRQVERGIDLSFVCELAVDFYSYIGRTSVDPVVFFKLQRGKT